MIRSYFFFLILFWFCSAIAIAQPSENNTSSCLIKIVDGTSEVLKIEMRDADYDLNREALPYYQLSKTTDMGQAATPILTPKLVLPVPANYEKVIRKYYEKYIGKEFEVIPYESFCKNENLNHHRLVPFRINAQNKLEELVSYAINWQIKDVPQVTAMRGGGQFANSSVLAGGAWYKIGVTRTGVHKITSTLLKDMGINISTLNPRKIRLYGNGGKMVPERNKDFRYDDLQENAIFVSGESDNTFDNSDYILFYATGTTEWKPVKSSAGLSYTATTSLYSDTSFYFLTVDLGDGKRMQTKSSLGSYNVSSTSYDYYNCHELNVINFGKTCREFYGEYFDITNSYSFKWNDGDFVLNDTIVSQVSLVSKHSDSVRFSVNCGTANYLVATRGLNLNGLHEDYAAPGMTTTKGLINNSSELSISITKNTPRSIGWLNKVIVNGRRNLQLNSQQFSFRDRRVSKPGNVCRYVMGNRGNSNVLLLDVSNPITPFIQEYSENSQGLEFVAASDSIIEYCVAPPTNHYEPTYVGRVLNQNLHALQQADYVIITHPLFMKEAERLGAYHQQKDGLSYVVAPIDKIYNEFSSGKQDPAAIRDFIRMLYSRNLSAGRQVKYVVLIGDGSFNNKNRSLINNSNYIPTYQSNSSLSETASIATDDFYAMMGDNEGFSVENSGTVDIGVGRFICRTPGEANDIINKVVNYNRTDANFSTATSENQSNSVMGDWRNWLLFLGDDEDGAEHMEQADSLTRIVKRYNPFCNNDKILLDAYQRYSTPGGFRYPDAANDFLKRIRRGALVFNYTGHGGEVGLTAERLIDIDIINGLENYNKLPLFVTATCEFSRYDDPARTSAGELCLLNARGGAIALLTTCRLAYSDANFRLNSFVLKNMFSMQRDGTRPHLGDIIQKTKAESGQDRLANFHLLGDPALTLAYPEQRVYTTLINNQAVTPTGSQTLAALDKITVSGYVGDTLGNRLSGFNGVVYPTVFDKEQVVACLLNSTASATNIGVNSDPNLLPLRFKLQRNILYRGKIEVVNGNFSFSFMVPKDISFSPGPGRISYYATNGLSDANGVYTNLVVGGDQKSTFKDDEGPKIDLYLNDKSFVNGSITDERPILFAGLSDMSGINTVGTGIGHDISVVLDQNTSKPINLNDFYEADLNSYQSGKIRYPFNTLSEGNHSISFKAWDIQNNSSTVNTDFVVANSAEVALDNVLNYPNPFTTRTKFMFQHNQGCKPLKVTVQVYSVSGKVVKTIQKSVSCDDVSSSGLDWDGKDDFGDKLARGVYIYKLAIIDSESKKAEKIEKLVILN